MQVIIIIIIIKLKLTDGDLRGGEAVPVGSLLLVRLVQRPDLEPLNHEEAALLQLAVVLPYGTLP